MHQPRLLKGTQLLLLCGTLLFSGCFTKKSGETETVPETAPTMTERPTTTAPERTEYTPSVAPANAKVDVDLYLEVSNGMKGFMPSPAAGKEPTGFQSRLTKITSEIQDGSYVQAKRFYLAKQDSQGRPVLDSVSYSTMKNTIATGINGNVLGTPLPDMLQAALANSVGRGAVSLIVSDFIHGPDPNKPGTFITLASDIRSSLKEAEQQKLVVAVLADASPFHGSYYPAVKKPAAKQNLTGQEIPYYIWVIGEQQAVQTIINKVLRNLPDQQAYFGFSYDRVPYSAITKSNQFKPKGVVYCTKLKAQECKEVNLGPEKEEPVQFTIGLNLSDLPASMQEPAYLKKNLKLAVSGGKASLGTVVAASADTKALPALTSYTHFVQVNVPQVTAATGALNLQLPLVVPAWISQWSTTNDNNPVAAPRKTYQFQSIIEGVQALYQDQNAQVFSATITFNKEK